MDSPDSQPRVFYVGCCPEVGVGQYGEVHHRDSHCEYQPLEFGVKVAKPVPPDELLGCAVASGKAR